MTRTAKLFRNGRSQAVRLPAEFRFEGEEVYVRRDLRTGEVVLCRQPDFWASLFRLADETPLPEDFLGRRDEVPQEREIF